ncbi:DUF3419 family protein [Parabacteroides sp. FAFU027]|uniref:DUF3419 family protein n=1 Tax=Parabacteroides sp. FAFU027 TaxID=2922715 RepID=UPI001FAEEE30|nr:DUF3419 family protein [Parabacteroides sp. FAFU027]
MPLIFDFGISQEDPLTELLVLDIRSGDRILSIASGGEVPLTLTSLVENISITAVDISETQILLCRMKILAANHLDFPENGKFLGYASMPKRDRREIYLDKIRPLLTDEEVSFWDKHLFLIEQGVVSGGRFEQYLQKVRFAVNLIVGKQNIRRLVDSQSLDEQAVVFDQYIATRKSLQLLFKIAFHPAVYKKRGLQEQALIHADETTGERFYAKFRDFCTSSEASGNYFLQYYMCGACLTEKSYPHFLQPENRQRFIDNLNRMELRQTSFGQALSEADFGHFNKIHLSNLGDWSDETDFNRILDQLKAKSQPGTLICNRYLQKNHFASGPKPGWVIDKNLSVLAQSKDRFPFYGIVALRLV